MKDLPSAIDLWADLTDVPVNQDGEIEIDWHIFDAGEDITTIWLWFEDEFNVSVAKDLFGTNDQIN